MTSSTTYSRRNGGLVGNIWQQSIARRSMMGGERTHNPSPAAASMLGTKRVKRAKAVLRRKGRKRAHRGNPLPAVAALLSSGVGKAVLSKLGFKTGSPRYEGGPLISSVQGRLTAIQGGDLNAVRELFLLSTSPGDKHRAQWSKVWNTELPALEGALPVAVQREIARLDPTSVFAARTKEAAATQSAAAARREARELATSERREALLAGVAGNVGKALLSRGRSLQRRPKRRRARRS